MERYRSEHANALPGSLSELTPALIKPCPPTPLMANPCATRNSRAKGYVIYSIGKAKDGQGAAVSVDEKRSQPLDITFTVLR